MKTYIQPWNGILKSQAGDKTAKSAKYHRISVPSHWIEMKSLTGFDPKASLFGQQQSNHAHYGVALFLEKELREIFGPDSLPMDCLPDDLDENERGERASITTTTAGAEWLAERQGYRHTIRFGVMLDTQPFARDIEMEIDPDVVVVAYHSHFAIKCRNPDTITMLEIKYGEYRASSYTYSGIADLIV